MYDNSCRICLTSCESSLVKLFDAGNDEKFTFCSGIEISENDELPKMICSTCLETVLIACDIKEKCIQTNFVLRQQLKNEPTDLVSVKLEDIETLSLGSFDNFIFTDSKREKSVEFQDDDQILQRIKPQKKTPSKNKSTLKSHTNQREKDEEDNTRRKPKAQDFCCFFCNKVFEQITLKNLHVKNDHSTELECTICGSKRSSSLAAERCIKDHKFGFDFLCQVCAKPFRRRCYLDLHVAKVHTKNQDHEFFSCDLCGVRSKYRENLNRHMKSVHLAVARSKFSCPDCPEKFYTTQTSLNLHLYREHKVPAPVTCPKCEAGFTYLSELKNHRHCCSGSSNNRKSFKNVNFVNFCEVVPEGFKCKACPKVFNEKQKWSWHYSSYHKSKRYCEPCDKTFNCYTNFKRHDDAFHKKIRKFVCDYPGCGKAYAANKALKDHKNTHTGEKPYGCQYCSFRTGDQTTAIKHRKKMHKNLVQQEIPQPHKFLAEFIKMNVNSCRICLTSCESSLVKLFDSGNDEKFMFCCGIEISENDELPKMICSTCLETVLIASDLKEKCIQTDFMLRQQLKNEPEELFFVKLEDIEALSIEGASETQLEKSEEFLDDDQLKQPMLQKKTPKKKSTLKSQKKQREKDEDDKKIPWTILRKPRARDYCCLFCDKVFKRIAHKNLHVKNDHSTELECTICGSKQPTSLLAERCIKDHKFGFDFLCQVCAKPFRRRCHLEFHVATVHTKNQDDGFYSCDLCCARSKYRENLSRHMKSVHLTVARSKFSCADCPDKFYTTQTSLNLHLYREHKVPAPVTCPKCEAGFTYLSELKNHRTCCSGSVNSRRSLKNADFVKFCEVSSEGFKCKKCPKVFNEKLKWSWHYTQYHKCKRYCEICDRTFHCYTNYKRHDDVCHKKIRKFVCDYPGCDKTYSTNNTLKYHKNSHTGAKPYGCKYCSFKTGDETTVIKHQKNMHKNLIKQKILPPTTSD